MSLGLAGLAKIARWNTGDFVKSPSVRPLSISISTSVCACAGEMQNKATATAGNAFLIYSGPVSICEAGEQAIFVVVALSEQRAIAL